MIFVAEGCLTGMKVFDWQGFQREKESEIGWQQGGSNTKKGHF